MSANIKGKSNCNTCCGGACMTKGSCQLLTWKDPKLSAKVFGSILGFLLLIKFVNVVSLFFRILSILLLGSGVAEYSTKALTGSGIVSKFKPVNKSCIGDCALTYSNHVATVIKKLELQFQDILASVNIELTIKSGILAFFLYKLTNCLSIWTITFFTTIFSFTLPKLYLSNKEFVDKTYFQIVNFLKIKLNELLKIANEKLGPYLAKVKEVLSPVFKLIESKIPAKPASSAVDSSVNSVDKSSTSGSTIHGAESNIKKVPHSVEETKSFAAENETETDFTHLGEQLKQEANSSLEGYSKEDIESANPFKSN